MLEDGEEGEAILSPESQAHCDSMTPGKVLAFVTGSANIPALGFDPRPVIDFDPSPGILAKSHTCVNQLVLPSNQSTCKPYIFARGLFESIVDGFSFGNI